MVTGLTTPLGIVVDALGGRIYWADEGGQVQRAELDGANVEPLVTGLMKPVGVAIDPSAGKLYWSDEGTRKIQRANLDGSAVEDLIAFGLSKPVGVDLDPTAGKIYWGDQVAGKVQRSNLDGTGVEDVVGGAGAVLDVKLDPLASRVYWTDDDDGTLRRADLDGGSVEVLPTVAFGVAVDAGPEIPETYCTPKTSSAGCLATIGTSGPTAQPVSGAGDYRVTAALVQGLKNGLVFVGVNGPATLPFSGGMLCVQPPTKRGPILNSAGSGALSCDGTFATIVNDGSQVPAGLDAGSGNSGWYQYWYRDPDNGAGLLGTALSDAVRLDFQ